MFPTKKAAAAIFVPLFLIWFLLIIFDLATAHKFELASGFRILWTTSSTRLSWTLRAALAVYRKYKWFLPILVMVFLVSPIFGILFIIYDIVCFFLFWLSKAYQEIDGKLARATTVKPELDVKVRRFGKQFVDAPADHNSSVPYGVSPYDSKVNATKYIEKLREGDYDEEDEVVIETAIRTGGFPVDWSADQVRAFRHIRGADKPYVVDAVTERASDGTAKAVHFMKKDGTWAEPEYRHSE